MLWFKLHHQVHFGSFKMTSNDLLRRRVAKNLQCVFVVFILRIVLNTGHIRGGWGVTYFPYILLIEIQTMFPQLAKRSAKVLPADLCSDHAHYVKIHGSTVLRRSENMAVEGGTVSHDYILVISQIY